MVCFCAAGLKVAALLTADFGDKAGQHERYSVFSDSFWKTQTLHHNKVCLPIAGGLELDDL